uniref:Tail tube assembly initiator n=2 Tax=unclassified bacterial viruses TaxID=12333 RepID=A0AAU6VYJ9_9VIRU
MSIVIRRSNGDILWFDAITQYDVTYSASVTKHPVATGGYVSDHTTTDNVVLQISGVLSDADFNISRPANLGSLQSYEATSDFTASISDENNLFKVVNKQYTNNSAVVYPVTISERTSINRILPEVVAQFTKDTIPNVYVQPQDKAKTALAVKREMVLMWKAKEEFQVLDLLDNFVIDAFGPCIFTNLSFREDESTGDALFPNMTIEQVVFTDLQEVSVTIKTSNKGRKTGTVTTKPQPVEGPIPENAPTNFVIQDVSAWRSPVTSFPK